VAQGIEHLPGMCKALNSTPQYFKKSLKKKVSKKVIEEASEIAS
jgi:phosphoribosyl-ATP pyrophosphohydrolase